MPTVGRVSPDVMTHIVNVQWGGGAFIFVEDWGNNLHRVTFSEGEPATQSISLPEATYDPGPDNPPRCSSDRRLICFGWR